MMDVFDERLKYGDCFGEVIHLHELIGRWDVNKKLIEELCFAKKIRPHNNLGEGVSEVINGKRVFLFHRTPSDLNQIVVEDVNESNTFDSLPDDTFFYLTSIRRFEDENTELKKKEWQKGFLEIKASRAPAPKKSGNLDRAMSAVELLNNPITELLARENPKDENERYFLLLTWLNPLRDAIAIQNSLWTDKCKNAKKKELMITASDRMEYEENIYRIRCKEDEIYQLLEESQPNENTVPTPTLEYGEPELSHDDAIGLYPALKLLGADWTAEEFALQVFYGGIRAFEKSKEDDILKPITNIQEWLCLHGRTEADSNGGLDIYHADSVLLAFRYSKPELSQFKPDYRYIAFSQAVALIAKQTGDSGKAERFLMNSLNRGEIYAHHPFVGLVRPELSMDGERWRNGYFEDWRLRRLHKIEFGGMESATIEAEEHAKLEQSEAIENYGSGGRQGDNIEENSNSTNWHSDPALTKLEKQHKAILEVIASKNFDPMAIPDKEKGNIKLICEADYGLLFDGESSFDNAWKKGRHLFKMANHASFSKRGRQ